MPRRKRHEEHDNHEAWAIPYGDLVTLLLAFFVVMYAMSSVNEGKYRVLSDSLSEAFNGKPRTQKAPSVGEQQPSADAKADSGGNAELEQVAEQVVRAMGSLVAAGEVHVRRYQNWVAVDISTDILFGSGVARVSDAAVPVLQHLADALKPFPNAIRVEGHTDDRPIRTAAFPSNWELSAARAASVVHLFMDRGVAAERLAVMGFGQYRPTSSNDNVIGRNANRRVAVVILGADTVPAGRN
ncbi:MAG TPA: flagellar motor protein MotD [Steroidobacteraceae bacterium]|jgi:chemotaxis protein MotB